jgi:hypothetical protein
VLRFFSSRDGVSAGNERRTAVDWIEKVFHVSPDGGNGTVEFVIYLVLISVAVLALNRVVRAGRRRATRRRRNR